MVFRTRNTNIITYFVEKLFGLLVVVVNIGFLGLSDRFQSFLFYALLRADCFAGPFICYERIVPMFGAHPIPTGGMGFDQMFASSLTIFMHHKIGFINLCFPGILAINFMMEIILAVFVLYFN